MIDTTPRQETHSFVESPFGPDRCRDCDHPSLWHSATRSTDAFRLLDYLWNTADVEAMVAAHDGGKVRDLFRKDDPLAIDIADVLKTGDRP